MYTQPKILIRRIVSRQNRLMAFYESSGIITNKDYNPFVIMAEFAVKWDLYYLLALLNSKLFSFLYTRKSQLALKDDFRQTTLAEIRGLPIKDIPKSEQTKLADNARLLSKLHQEHFELKDKIVRRIVENFKVKPSRKLEEIADMTFGQFKDEIESLVKRKLKLAEQDEWEPYLKENIEKLRELRNKIIVTENETDRLVYALYSIGEREKGLVESSLRGKLI